MAHTDAFISLAEFTQQRNFNPIFVSIPVFDGIKIASSGFGKGRRKCQNLSYGPPYDLAVELNKTGAQEVFFFKPAHYCLHICQPLIQLLKKPVNHYIYIYHYIMLYYVTTDKTAHENTDPTRIYHFVASINNITITKKLQNRYMMTLGYYVMHSRKH